jgi:cytochrome b involved in lipid metabolism
MFPRMNKSFLCAGQRMAVRSWASNAQGYCGRTTTTEPSSSTRLESSWKFWSALAATAVAGTAVTCMEAAPKTTATVTTDRLSEQAVAPKGLQAKESSLNQPPPRPDLPTIPLEEVNDHCDEESLWYTYRGAVYDLTFFLNGHPGGTPRLLMAAGQDLEPYWNVYQQHFRGHLLEWMERYRIGNLSPQDAEKARSITFSDMYQDEPVRDKDLLGTSETTPSMR